MKVTVKGKGSAPIIVQKSKLPESQPKKFQPQPVKMRLEKKPAAPKVKGHQEILELFKKKYCAKITEKIKALENDEDALLKELKLFPNLEQDDKVPFEKWSDLFKFFQKFINRAVSYNPTSGKWCLKCDEPENSLLQEIILEILRVSTMLCDNISDKLQSLTAYNKTSMPHIVRLFYSNNTDIVVAALHHHGQIMRFTVDKKKKVPSTITLDKSMLKNFTDIIDVTFSVTSKTSLVKMCQEDLIPGDSQSLAKVNQQTVGALTIEFDPKTDLQEGENVGMLMKRVVDSVEHKDLNTSHHLRLFMLLKRSIAFSGSYKERIDFIRILCTAISLASIDKDLFVKLKRHMEDAVTVFTSISTSDSDNAAEVEMIRIYCLEMFKDILIYLPMTPGIGQSTFELLGVPIKQKVFPPDCVFIKFIKLMIQSTINQDLESENIDTFSPDNVSVQLLEATLRLLFHFSRRNFAKESLRGTGVMEELFGLIDWYTSTRSQPAEDDVNSYHKCNRLAVTLIKNAYSKNTHKENEVTTTFISDLKSVECFRILLQAFKFQVDFMKTDPRYQILQDKYVSSKVGTRSEENLIKDIYGDGLEEGESMDGGRKEELDFASLCLISLCSETNYTVPSKDKRADMFSIIDFLRLFNTFLLPSELDSDDKLLRKQLTPELVASLCDQLLEINIPKNSLFFINKFKVLAEDIVYQLIRACSSNGCSIEKICDISPSFGSLAIEIYPCLYDKAADQMESLKLARNTLSKVTASNVNVGNRKGSTTVIPLMDNVEAFKKLINSVRTKLDSDFYDRLMSQVHNIEAKLGPISNLRKRLEEERKSIDRLHQDKKNQDRRQNEQFWIKNMEHGKSQQQLDRQRAELENTRRFLDEEQQRLILKEQQLDVQLMQLGSTGAGSSFVEPALQGLSQLPDTDTRNRKWKRQRNTKWDNQASVSEGNGDYAYGWRPPAKQPQYGYDGYSGQDPIPAGSMDIPGIGGGVLGAYPGDPTNMFGFDAPETKRMKSSGAATQQKGSSSANTFYI